MLDLTANEQALAKGRGSSRLLAHRLANFDAEQAKREGAGFEAAWKARHGATATQPSSPKPVAVSAKPAAPAAPPVAASKPAAPVTPPAIAKELQAAADRQNAVIAKAAADFAARQKAEAEQVARRAAADAVWAKVNARHEAGARTAKGLPLLPDTAKRAGENDGRTEAQRRSDAVWEKANARVMADRRMS